MYLSVKSPQISDCSKWKFKSKLKTHFLIIAPPRTQAVCLPIYPSEWRQWPAQALSEWSNYGLSQGWDWPSQPPEPRWQHHQFTVYNHAETFCPPSSNRCTLKWGHCADRPETTLFSGDSTLSDQPTNTAQDKIKLMTPNKILLPKLLLYFQIDLLFFTSWEIIQIN